MIRKVHGIINKVIPLTLIMLIIFSYILPFVNASTKQKLHVDVKTDNDILIGFASKKADGKSIGNGLYRDFALPYEQYKVYNKIAYCVQPLVKSGTDEAEILDYNETIKLLGKDRVDKLWKWAFFGIGYNGDNSKERAIATQMYFWSLNGLNDLKNSNKHNNKDNKLLYMATHNMGVKITPESNGLWKTYPIHTKDVNFNKRVYDKYREIQNLVDNFNISKPNMTYGQMIKLQPNLHQDFMFKFAKFKNKQDLFLIGFHPDLPTEMKLKIIKKDSETKNNISVANVEFLVYNAETNKPLDFTIKTNNQGIGISKYNLKIGKYYLKEIKAPKGYTISNKKHYFEIKQEDLFKNIYEINLNGEEIKVLDYEIENTPQTGTLQLNKYGEKFKGWKKEDRKIQIEKNANITHESRFNIMKNMNCNIQKHIISIENGDNEDNKGKTKKQTMKYTETIHTKTDNSGSIFLESARIKNNEYDNIVMSKISNIFKKIYNKNIAKVNNISLYQLMDTKYLDILSKDERNILQYFLNNIVNINKIIYEVLDNHNNIVHTETIVINSASNEKDIHNSNKCKDELLKKYKLNEYTEIIKKYCVKDKVRYTFPKEKIEYEKYNQANVENITKQVYTPIYAEEKLEDCYFSIVAKEDIYTNDKKECIFKANETLSFANSDIYLDKELIYHKNEVIGRKTYIFKNKSLDENKRIQKLLKDNSVKYIKTSRVPELNRITGIPLGKYIIKENLAKKGYVAQNSGISIEFTPQNQNLKVDFKESPKIVNKRVRQHIKINRKHFEDEKIIDVSKLYSRVHFGLYNKEKIGELDKDTLVDVKSPDNNGVITFNNIPIGEYYLKELYTPFKYELDKKVYNISIKGIKNNCDENSYSNVNIYAMDKNNHNISSVELNLKKDKTDITFNYDNIFNFNIVNRLKRGAFELLKIDSNTKTGISGTQFKLYSVNNGIEQEVSNNTYITDKDGKIKIGGLVYGNYILKEIKSSIGYVLDNLSLRFAIYDNNSSSKIVAENSKTHIGIEKRSTLTNNHLKGNIIVLKDENGKIVDKWNTSNVSADGIHHIYGLEANKSYYISELEVANNIDKKSMIKDYKIIVKNTKEMQLITLKNTENYINIVKEDLHSKEKLYNAKFNIYTEDGNLFKDVYGNSEIHISEKDKYGVRVYGLERNKVYYIQEKQAPKGYILNNKRIMFKLKDNNTDNTIKIFNEKQTNVQILKVDENNMPLANAKLQILKNGKVLYEFISTDKPYTIYDLKIGETYILRETSSPKGYNICKDVYFKVKNTNDIQTVRIVNTKTKVLPLGDISIDNLNSILYKKVDKRLIPLLISIIVLILTITLDIVIRELLLKSKMR